MWDVWVCILRHAGPLDVLPSGYKEYTALLRIQDAARELLKANALYSVNPDEIPPGGLKVKMFHAGRWKRGKLKLVD